MRTKLLLLFLTVLVLGCARSQYWRMPLPEPTDQAQLKRDIAFCRAQSTAATAAASGLIVSPVTRKIYNDCMLGKGYEPARSEPAK